MSRIGESNDDQRIREMQEADYRQKVDTEKRADQERLGKSFQEVMTQRESRETARRTTANTKTRDDAEAAAKKNDPNAPDKKKALTLGNPKNQELQKRAALATQQQGQLNKARAQLSESARAQETERNTELVRKSDDDRDAVRADLDKDVTRDQQVEEQKLYEKMALPIAVDADDEARSGQHRRNPREGGGGDDGDRQAQAVGAAKAEAPRGALPAKIPTEILEHIAKSVAVAAAADGKVSMSISLKGTMLDGVTLNVTASKGKVRCVFEGCDKQLGNLIEASKGELMRQLGKRGLELDILRVK